MKDFVFLLLDIIRYQRSVIRAYDEHCTHLRKLINQLNNNEL